MELQSSGIESSWVGVGGEKKFSIFFPSTRFRIDKVFLNGNEIAARFGLSWKFLHTLDDDDPGGKREISENLSQRSN